MQRYNYVPENMLSSIKSDFFKFCSIAGGGGGGGELRRLVPLWKLNYCDVISLKAV